MAAGQRASGDLLRVFKRSACERKSGYVGADLALKICRVVVFESDVDKPPLVGNVEEPAYAFDKSKQRFPAYQPRAECLVQGTCPHVIEIIMGANPEAYTPRSHLRSYVQGWMRRRVG